MTKPADDNSKVIWFCIALLVLYFAFGRRHAEHPDVSKVLQEMDEINYKSDTVLRSMREFQRR